MPHSYTSSFPEGIEVDPGIKSFFEAFYQISDTEAKHQEYVDQFTDDATVIVGSRKAVGRDGGFSFLSLFLMDLIFDDFFSGEIHGLLFGVSFEGSAGGGFYGIISQPFT